MSASSLTIFHFQTHNYMKAFYSRTHVVVYLWITTYWLTIIQNVLLDTRSNYNTDFNELVSKVHSSDPMDYKSNISGWKIAIPPISRSKNMNNMQEHIEKLFLLKVKMEKFTRNLLSEAVLLKNWVLDQVFLYFNFYLEYYNIIFYSDIFYLW
jgi:hypothetical protein